MNINDAGTVGSLALGVISCIKCLKKHFNCRTYLRMNVIDLLPVCMSLVSI